MLTDDLYFMRVHEFVKIGRSRDPWSRRKDLQCSTPFEIGEPVILQGRGDQERDWHKRFADKRVRGEWFLWCEEIANAIEFALHAPPLARLIEMQDAGEI